MGGNSKLIWCLYKFPHQDVFTTMSNVLRVSERVVDHIVKHTEVLEGCWPWSRRSGRVHVVNTMPHSESELCDLMRNATETFGCIPCPHPMARFVFFGQDVLVLGRDVTRFDFDLFDHSVSGADISGADRPIGFRRFNTRQTNDAVGLKITTICNALNEKVSCQIFSVILGDILRAKQRRDGIMDRSPVCFSTKCIDAEKYGAFTRAVVDFMFDAGYSECGDGSFQENGSSQCIHWVRQDSMFYLYVSLKSAGSDAGVVVDRTSSGIYVFHNPDVAIIHSYYIPFYNEMTFRITDGVCNYSTLNKFEADLFDNTVPDATRWKYISDITDLSDTFPNLRLRGICRYLKCFPANACVLITKFLGAAKESLPFRKNGPVVTVQYEIMDEIGGIPTFLWYELIWRYVDFDLILISYELKHSYPESQLPYASSLKTFPDGRI
jgi:hypothetical protein